MRGSGDGSIREPLGGENGLIEPNPETPALKGLYIARMARILIRDCREVAVRFLNATRRDRKLTKGSPMAHCEPVTLMTLPDLEQPQVRDTTSQLSLKCNFIR
jgi:hypothetical protein